MANYAALPQTLVALRTFSCPTRKVILLLQYFCGKLKLFVLRRTTLRVLGTRLERGGSCSAQVASEVTSVVLERWPRYEEGTCL